MKANEVLFVEFVGLPGAGKTTIANKLIHQLQAENYKIYSREMLIGFRETKSIFKRGLTLMLFLMVNLPLVIKCIFYGLSFKPLNSASIRYTYNGVRTVLKTKQAVLNAKKNGSNIVIFDQGIIQDLWSVGVTGEIRKIERFHSRLVKLLELIYRKLTPLIVFLEVDPQTSLERMRFRDPTPYRLDNMAEKTLKQILLTKEPHIKLLVTTAFSIKSVNKFSIENNCNSFDTKTKQLVKFITEEGNNLYFNQAG